jgi:hypothetical protein
MKVNKLTNLLNFHDLAELLNNFILSFILNRVRVLTTAKDCEFSI